MTPVLRAPLLPAAGGAVCIALAVQLAPLAGISLAALLAGLFAILAIASADRMTKTRRRTKIAITAVSATRSAERSSR